MSDARVVAITGASSGIGRATAEYFAAKRELFEPDRARRGVARQPFHLVRAVWHAKYSLDLTQGQVSLGRGGQRAEDMAWYVSRGT